MGFISQWRNLSSDTISQPFLWLNVSFQSIYGFQKQPNSQITMQNDKLECS
jgi:hypothetical protein